jgi:hypothetical protein
MKAFITPTYTFTPGASGVGTLDLSSISGFDIKRLIAVINQTRGELIYSTGSPSLKYTSVASGVITLNADTSTHNSADKLQVIYEEIGQKASAGSHAVALSTEQEAILSAISGKDFSTSAKQDAAKTVLDTIAAKDFSTSAKQDILAMRVGDVTEAAPASDTASSGLNGRLQRIAQRLTSLIGLLPGSLGQKTMANSLAVTLASDQSALPIVETALSITFQEILNLTTTAQTFTAPAGAKWMLIEADDTNSANIRVKIGGTATISSGIQFQAGRSEMIKGGGNISVIAESGTNQKISVQFGA